MADKQAPAGQHKQDAAPAGGRRPDRRRRRRRARRDDKDGEGKQDWVPVTKLGRLVKEGKIKQLEELFFHSIPIKEHQIVDHFLSKKPDWHDEVLRIMPVQKQSAAGQRTRFKAYVMVGDKDGHLGLGTKVAKEVATAIRGAIMVAKMNIVPIRRGYWGNKVGKPHTVPTRVTGKAGSVRVRLIPAPRGAGIVAARVPKKILSLTGIDDCYTRCFGKTKTVGNFAHATFRAVEKLYGYLTPELWDDYMLVKSPFQEHTDFLANYDTQKHRKPTTTAAAAQPFQSSSTPPQGQTPPPSDKSTTAPSAEVF